MCSGKAQGQFVGFAARIDKETHVERVRHGRDQSLRVGIEVVVQVARVGVQHGHLPLPGLDDARMAVADVGHVVIGIQVFAAGFVVHVLHPTPLDLDRVPVSDAQIPADDSLPRSKRLCLAGLLPSNSMCRNAEDHVGIWRKVGPDSPLAEFADAGIVTVETQEVVDELKVQVWGPSAVDVGGADRPNLLARCKWLAYGQTLQR